MSGGHVRKLVALAAVLALSATAPPAFADEIANTADGTVDATLETVAIASGGSAQVGFQILASDTVPNGDVAGCNATVANPATVNLDVPAGVTADDTSLEFTACDTTQNVTFSSSTPGSYTIDVATVTGGETGSLFDADPAAFTLEVNGSGIVYTGDATAVVDQWITLSATLTANPGGGGLSGRTVAFTVGTGGSAQTVNATTDANGIASSTALVVAQDAGSVAVSADFAGDASNGPSSDSSSITVSKATPTLTLSAPAEIRTGQTMNLSATLTSSVVTTSGSTQVGISGRAVTFDICPTVGSCTTVSGTTTNASGISTVAVGWVLPAGTYTIVAYFAGASDPRYIGASSASRSVRARYRTALAVTADGGRYRSAVVVKATLTYTGQVGQPALAGRPVKFYKMSSATSTNLNTATLIGTATTGADGTASVLWRMDTLPTPPRYGARLGFAAVYGGSLDGNYASVKSATVERDVRQRTPKIVLAGTRVGANLVGSVTVTDAPITFTTRSNGVATNTTIGGLPVAGAAVTVRWLHTSGVVFGSFSVTTNTSGVANFNKPILTGTKKASARWGPSGPYLAALSNVVTFG